MGRDLKATLDTIYRDGAIVGRRGVACDSGPDSDNPVLRELSPMLDDILRHLTGTFVALKMLSLVYHQLCQKQQKILKRTDGVGITQEFVKPVMQRMRAAQLKTPRLACMLVTWKFEYRQGLSPQEQESHRWTRRQIDASKGKAKGWFTEDMWLYLVCAHTYLLVPCGPDGHGYRIQRCRTRVGNAVGSADGDGGALLYRTGLTSIGSGIVSSSLG